MHYIPLSCISSECNFFFLNPGGFAVVYTKGEGSEEEAEEEEEEENDVVVVWAKSARGVASPASSLLALVGYHSLVCLEIPLQPPPPPLGDLI